MQQAINEILKSFPQKNTSEILLNLKTRIMRFSILTKRQQGVVFGILLISNIYSINICEAVEPNPLSLSTTDRILILAPHPDDESLCCGGIIRRATEQSIPVKIVYLTHGDNNEWSFMMSQKKPMLNDDQAKQMGMLRSQEALNAAMELGARKENVVFLGYPDSGILSMWNNRWKNSLPYTGFLTQAVSVPYENAFRPGAPYLSDEILGDLKSVIGSFQPTKLFVSHPADRNHDHRALYFFTRIALWDLKLTPDIYPFLIHYKKWPQPIGFFPEKNTQPPVLFENRILWNEFLLNEADIVAKTKAIKKHKTQYVYSRKFLNSFIRKNELFGDFEDIHLKDLISLNGHDDTQELTSSVKEDLDDIYFQKGQVVLKNENLLVQVNLSGLLSGTLKFVLTVYGHNDDTPFIQMPKLVIRCGVVDCEVYEGVRRKRNVLIQITKDSGSTIFTIPLKALGEPKRIIVGMSTLLGDQTIKFLPGGIFEVQ